MTDQELVNKIRGIVKEEILNALKELYTNQNLYLKEEKIYNDKWKNTNHRY